MAETGEVETSVPLCAVVVDAEIAAVCVETAVADKGAGTDATGAVLGTTTSGPAAMPGTDSAHKAHKIKSAFLDIIC